MSQSHRRLDKESASVRPTLDFVQAQKVSGLRTPLALLTVLLAGAFVFQEYQPGSQKTSGSAAHGWRSDTPLAENGSHALVLASALEAEVAAAQDNNYDRLLAEKKANDPIAGNDLPAPVAVKTGIKPLPRQLQLPARHSSRAIQPVPVKSRDYAGGVRAVPPERKIVDADMDVVVGAVALPRRGESQPSIVIPEVTFSRHGRLMEVQMNREEGASQ